uniref:Glutathione peroxidase n=1 Tax=Paulinella micropora TaxID=1928728 RepID=A0A1L5YC04_9EUKA|nr:Glutathione peroxidase [Paulinella micropora]AQX44998.1 Glutathione peroxidase [Paulinella micropora]
MSKTIVRRSNGNEVCLGDYKGNVLLIVNVASRCGFTRQYAGLQKLQDTYNSQGFRILAFPCNDFGNQEPGSLSEIQEFCSMTYGVNFEFFDKVHAKGTKTAPYDILTEFESAGDVEWNFEKFLIGKNSNVVARYKSNIEPDSSNLISAVEEELKR